MKKFQSPSSKTKIFGLSRSFCVLRSLALPIHGIGKLGSEGLEKKTHRRNRRKLVTDLILILATYVHIYRFNFNFNSNFNFNFNFNRKEKIADEIRSSCLISLPFQLSYYILLGSYYKYSTYKWVTGLFSFRSYCT
jgi:hypothetical protein